jgi:hypothetical protein
VSSDIFAAIIGATATVAATILGVWLTRRWSDANAESLSSSRAARTKRRHRYDIFLSTPLAALPSDVAIEAGHQQAASIVAVLEQRLGLTVYWAGRHIRAKADFEAEDLSARKDVEALLESRSFLLVLPQRLASSVLFEAGIALRECLTSIYFVHESGDLPFLMKKASQAFSNVRLYEGDIPEGLIALLERHGRDFFDPRHEPS